VDTHLELVRFGVSNHHCVTFMVRAAQGTKVLLDGAQTQGESLIVPSLGKLVPQKVRPVTNSKHTMAGLEAGAWRANIVWHSDTPSAQQQPRLLVECSTLHACRLCASCGMGACVMYHGACSGTHSDT
jgi:hypothetical protein